MRGRQKSPAKMTGLSKFVGLDLAYIRDAQNELSIGKFKFWG
jgi:hypothetical protein